LFLLHVCELRIAVGRYCITAAGDVEIVNRNPGVGVGAGLEPCGVSRSPGASNPVMDLPLAAWGLSGLDRGKPGKNGLSSRAFLLNPQAYFSNTIFF
jgi:hypothetical protein